ncbi:RNA polymerase sigma factor [Dictyobacter arantiisoli]|uniref:RNA polymerase sigma factor n=1 Tax=Dictyobacter arantiisoli TaxID=2014874 RepID=A0A5A5TEH0_9CHLR|nr:RNA polymerase sigma factor [Dictyobacter arantiisoli]GCF09727.1 RNA polymerase sigma factor [Dictyobacter arantiisoli]
MSLDTHELNLIRQTLAGDQEAFGALVLVYERPLLTYIYSILRDWECTRDVVQETLTAAYYALPRWKPPELNIAELTQTTSVDEKCHIQIHPLSSWLYRIATNKALDFLKKQKRLEHISNRLSVNMQISDILPEEGYLVKELLVEALHLLSEEDALCLVLRFCCDESYGEIAQKINSTTEAVRKRIARGLITLRSAYVTLKDEEGLL